LASRESGGGKKNVRDRGFQIVLIASTLALSWPAMMAVHELGHVLVAWATGGRVTRVVLGPWEFSRTDVAPNPRPLPVAWGGVAWGSLLPLAVWAVVRTIGPRYAWLARFFAGFCLVANGAYLAGGALYPVGDAADLARLGVARWQLAAAGLPLIAGGLCLWNGLGPHFGLGNGGKVDERVAVWLPVLLVVTVLLDWLISQIE
jgi:hypothetical protein